MTGSITVLADSYNGRKLNSPNDVVVAQDGSIWFTDPVFGILGYYEGHRDESENTPAVYRLDGKTGQLGMMVDDIPGPNGLAFSPDEKTLYVVASRAMPHRTILAYDVTAGGIRARARQGADRCRTGRLARTGSVSTSTATCGAAGAWAIAELDGVRVFSASGHPIGHIDLPERCANVCFGGRYRNRLFMAASHGLYALYVNTQGVPGG